MPLLKKLLLFIKLFFLRKKFEKIFSPETSSIKNHSIPSSGHCAVVALFLHKKFGGQLISTKINNTSNWFNRINGYDIDLTGDQFGFSKIRIKKENKLYHNIRIRFMDEINEETKKRFELFKGKYIKLFG